MALALLLPSCGPRPVHEAVSGTIEIDQAHVASRYGGRVKSIFVSEGDALQEGQTIAEIEAAELATKLDQARAILAELQAGPRVEEIAAAQSEWEVQVAERQQAELDAKRARELFEQKTISSTEQEQAATKLRRLEKSAAAARSRLDLLRAGTRSERLDQARAQVAEVETQLAELKIKAPAPSVVEVLQVKPGDVLSPNRPIATLLLTNHLWVRVFVPEPWLGKIHVGQSVRVRVDSEPGRDFGGTVEQIARAAEFTPRNVQTVAERVKQVFGIKVRLNEAGGSLRAGMAADVAFPEKGGPP